MHKIIIKLRDIKSFLGEAALKAKFQTGSSLEKAAVEVIANLQNEQCPRCGKDAKVIEKNKNIIVLCKSCKSNSCKEGGI